MNQKLQFRVLRLKKYESRIGIIFVKLEMRKKDFC